MLSQEEAQTGLLLLTSLQLREVYAEVEFLQLFLSSELDSIESSWVVSVLFRDSRFVKSLMGCNWGATFRFLLGFVTWLIIWIAIRYKWISRCAVVSFVIFLFLFEGDTVELYALAVVGGRERLDVVSCGSRVFVGGHLPWNAPLVTNLQWVLLWTTLVRRCCWFECLPITFAFKWTCLDLVALVVDDWVGQLVEEDTLFWTVTCFFHLVHERHQVFNFAFSSRSGHVGCCTQLFLEFNFNQCTQKYFLYQIKTNRIFFPIYLQKRNFRPFIIWKW